MICVVIKGPNFEDIYQQVSKAISYADLVELRLDLFTNFDIAALKKLRSIFSIPMIFTLRSRIQGGGYSKSEDERLADIWDLVAVNPEYLDLENHVCAKFIQKIAFKYPTIKLILSFHDFSETPEDLEGLYREMKKVPVFLYKIALKPNNCLDTMRLISWTKKKADFSLITISMGPNGHFSRILGAIIGCPITYASLEDDPKNAIGQVSAERLVKIFHYHTLNPHTRVYGLIGDPINESISEDTHNSLIEAYNLDAVYFKIQVPLEELASFLQYAKNLPFHGLSVTMPLKEHVLPYLDHIDPAAFDIGAVNTLLFEEGKIFGFNTDGLGALNALETVCEVKNKRIVIIGAGGASKAIAYEAIHRGGILTILNRDVKKAQQMAGNLKCFGEGLEYMITCVQNGYDILINCTPIPLPISSDFIIPNSIIMDIVTFPKDTKFLNCGREKGCQIIYGYMMFIEQAIEQFSIWFKNQINLSEGRKILESRASNILVNQIN